MSINNGVQESVCKSHDQAGVTTYLASTIQSHGYTQYCDVRLQIVSDDAKGLRLDPEAKLRVCFHLLAHKIAANFPVFGPGDSLGATVFAVIRVDPCLEVLPERVMFRDNDDCV